MCNILPEEKLNRLSEAMGTLDKLTNGLNDRCIKLASAEREYRKALAKKQLEYRTKGRNEPAQLVLNYAKGDEKVAELRYARDIAKINVDVCKETLKNHRMQIEVLRSSLAYDRATYLNS
ncbi:hypothetical protein [Clostridium sp. HBUAS56017]|uniref:hypothetical protein n=1 Tax=Clostridium sp. HBUAS56017 TaxID=2571128 RepID=UPI0011777813|nr:hypothetical protein [Clostridium sp. HBUAS56017]